MAFTPTYTSSAPSVSANASASASRTVFRAGTYVTGIASAMRDGLLPFGTAMALSVSAEPPNAERSTFTIR
jgi:hypothetical protein